MINITFQEQEFFHLQTKLSQARTGQDVGENISEFINVMSEICDPLFAKTIRIGSNNNITSAFKANHPPWFDQECTNRRKIFYSELNNFRLNKNTQTQTRLVQARKKNKYDKSKTKNLLCQNKVTLKKTGEC